MTSHQAPIYSLNVPLCFRVPPNQVKVAMLVQQIYPQRTEFCPFAAAGHVTENQEFMLCLLLTELCVCTLVLRSVEYSSFRVFIF